jgi:osmotically-inducible protein OsmY
MFGHGVTGKAVLAVGLLAAGLAQAVPPVEEADGGSVADALLATHVRASLLEHLHRDAIGIEVDAVGSKVWLRGSVERRATEELAEEVARAVPGVRWVVNRIEVGPRADGAATPVARGVQDAELEVADGLLELRVKARLLEHVGLVAFSVEVEATEGVVSLSGKLPDPIRRRLVLDVVRDTRGVVRIVDLLRVAG